ncbi:MAG: tetratricopeptide repeat protein [Acidobacteriota bacterium]
MNPALRPWLAYPRPALLGILIAGTLLTYSLAGANEFLTYDDPLYVTDNPRVQSGLSWRNIQWALTSLEVANWHPLTWLSHMADAQWFGLNAGAHHWMNVLWHTMNVVLVFVVMADMTGANWASFLVAGLFAVHPMNVESVAWIAERKNLLSMFFALVAVRSYVSYVRCPNWHGYVLVVVAFALGLMSKPMVVTLPCVLLLLDYWPLRRLKGQSTVAENRPLSHKGAKPGIPIVSAGKSWTWLAVEKLPMLSLVLASSVITIHAQGASGDLRTLETLDGASRVGNALIAYLTYLAKAFWPTKLSVFYPFDSGSVQLSDVLLAVFALGTVSVIAWRTRTNKPFLIVGWLWFLGTLFPVIGIVQVGDQALANRYGYLPLIGLFTMTVWATEQIGREAAKWRIGLRAISIVLLCVLALATRRQLEHWRTSASLFEYAVSVTRDNYVAYSNLGGAYRQSGDLELAEQNFRKAIEVNPASNSVQRFNLAQTQANLSFLLHQKGTLEEAARQAESALAANPNFALACNNLASIRADQGRKAEAVTLYRRALLLAAPLKLKREIYFNLGNVLTELHRRSEAIEAYRHVLEYDSRHVQTCINLGALLYVDGNFDGAIALFDRALEMAPSASSYYLKGLALARQGHRRKAEECYRMALQLDPNHVNARLHLAEIGSSPSK